MISKIKVLFFVFLSAFYFTPVFSAQQESGGTDGHSPVVLTEIMYDPIGSEYYTEFVEIVNLSGTDTIDLSGWQIGDGAGFDQITDAGAGLKIAPGQFGLILDSGYFTHATLYDSLIPGDALVLTIDGASFGKKGWPNTVATNVILLDASGLEADRYTYSPGNTPGHSDEKIDLSGDNSAVNWGESLQLNGSPGFRNSISPREKDIGLALSLVPADLPKGNESWNITLKIVNRGIDPAVDFQLTGYVLSATDSSDSLQFFSRIFGDTLQDQSSIEVEIPLLTDVLGERQFTFVLSWQRDQNLHDNYLPFPLIVLSSPGDVVINEIMYYPEYNQSEWLEIYNVSPFVINLSDWRIGTELSFDDASSLPVNFSAFQPDSLLVLSNDSLFCSALGGKGLYLPALPKLRDSGMDLQLFDPAGIQIDSVSYDPGWGKKRGYSLERIWHEKSGIDSLNWQVSKCIGGSPAKINTNSPLHLDLAVTGVEVVPNPVPFKADAKLNISCKNTGRSEINGIRFEIFLDLNSDSTAQDAELLLPVFQKEIRLQPEESSSQYFSLPQLPSGIFELSVRLSVSGDQNERNNIKNVELRVGYPSGCMVLNEIMYQPIAGQPEWIELFNRWSEKVNLREWTFYEPAADKYYEITNRNLFISPGSFCVISADSNMTIPQTGVFVVAEKFPSLNNTGEQIRLTDFSGSVIDSLMYSSNWGGDLGISLERINPDLATQDSSNWASSAAATGMTPGEENSLFTAFLPDEATLSVSPNPFSPDGDGFEDHTIIQYDLPMSTAYVSVKIFDIMGREVCELLNTAPSGSHRQLIWDGKKNSSENLRIGVYIIYLEALNAKMGLIKQVKKPVVIAGRL